MRRSYLVNTNNRVLEFHQQGKEYVQHLEDLIKHYQDVIETASMEIDKVTKLRDVVLATTLDPAIGVGNGKPIMPAVSHLANGTNKDDAQLAGELEKELDIEFDKERGIPA